MARMALCRLVAASRLPVAEIFALLAFLLNAWRRVGRDPPEGTVVPIFNPPDALYASGYAIHDPQKLRQPRIRGGARRCGRQGTHQTDRGEWGDFLIDQTLCRTALHTGNPPPRCCRAGSRSIPWSLGRTHRNGQRKSLEILRCDEVARRHRFEKRFSGAAFHRNLGWAFAAIWKSGWLSCGQRQRLSLSPKARRKRKMALASAFLFGVAAIIWGMVPKSSDTKGCLVQAVPFVLVGLGALLALTDYSGRFSRWSLASARYGGPRPAICAQRIRLDRRAHQGRPRDARPYCRISDNICRSPNATGLTECMP